MTMASSATVSNTPTTGRPIDLYSAEEKQFLKMFTLIVKSGTPAVRLYFDSKIHPSKLQHELNIQSNKDKLNRLKSRRIIHAGQWDKLYPSMGGVVSSTSFDITLMFLLLREIGGINAPKTGWDSFPLASDHSEEADIVRLKIYRNEMAHNTDGVISNVDFQATSNDIRQAILRLGHLGGKDFATEITRVLTCSIDETDMDLWNEMRLELQQIKKEIVEDKTKKKTHRIAGRSKAELTLKENIGKAKNQSELAEQLFREINQTGLIEKAEEIESKLRESVEKWKSIIDKTVSLKEELEMTSAKDGVPLMSTDVDFEYLRSAEELGHQHNICGLVFKASMEIKSKKEVQSLQENIAMAKKLLDEAKTLVEDIKNEPLIENAETMLRALARKEDGWHKSIEYSVKLEKELQRPRLTHEELLTTDTLEQKLQSICPAKEFRYLQYLHDAQKLDHEHNISGIISKASKEIKFKKEVQNLQENITMTKHLWNEAKDVFEDIKQEPLTEKAEKMLEELERKEYNWSKCIKCAVKLEKEIQSSRLKDEEPLSVDQLQQQLQRILPCNDFRYLQYLHDAQNFEDEQSIHGLVNKASKEVKLKKEEISPGKLKSWADDEKTFYPTKATEYIYKEIKSKRSCIVSGLPGAGKTAIIHHIGLRLKNEGYRLCSLQNLKEIISKMYKFGEEDKQVYVIDDVFGVHGVDENKRKEWSDENKDELERCLDNKNISILCSSRKQVVEDTKLSNIKPRYTIINISEGTHGLSSEERTGIFEKHALAKHREDLLTENKDQLKARMKETVKKVECPLGCFPLVCHLYTGDKETNQTIEEYFFKPLKVVAEHLQKLEVEDRLCYFCLLMCLIYDNKLPVKTLEIDKEHKDTKNKREEILELCELHVSTSRPTIKNKMDTLLQTFVKLKGDVYQFIHDIIHNAVIKHVSTLSSSMHKVILRHSSGEFLKDRVHLDGVDCKNFWGDPGHDAFSCINIRRDVFYTWGLHVLEIIRCGIITSDQLYKDIDEGTCSIDDNRVIWDNSWWDVFEYNPCVRSTDGDIAIAQALADKTPTDVHTIMCTPGYSLYPYRDPTHRLIALQWAMKGGLVNSIKQILSMISQTQIQELNSADKCLLRSAYSEQCNSDIIKALIEGGICKGAYNDSPLWRYVDSGDYETAEALLSNGADINQCDKDGRSLLHQSVSLGDYKTIEVLLSYGAQVNKCDRYGRSAFYWSVWRGDFKATQLLISRGADVNQCDKTGWSPLFACVNRGDYKTTELLLSHAADINQCDTNYCVSPLIMSQVWEHHTITELLQSKGAVCIYKGKQYNHVTDIPDSEVLHSWRIRERLQVLKKRQNETT